VWREENGSVVIVREHVPGGPPGKQEAWAMRTILRNPKARGAFLTWIAVWPLITVLRAVGEPVLADLPLALQTLVLTGVLAPLMSIVVMPRMLRWAEALLPRADVAAK